ncbi:Tuberous sclerosis 2-like protein [Ciborinia camelliae]|nr:Tuberous sclerosis 2-like protein [Ciborinia camelliae]
MYPPFTNRWNLELDSRVQRNPRASNPRASNPRASMPPPVGDAAQTPEARNSSGIASVFKSLTGGKITKSPSTQSPATGPLQLDNGSVPQKLNHEPTLEQLQAGHSLADRIRAAEYLRRAVIDYPMENVSNLDRDQPVSMIFIAGRDLIEPTQTQQARIAGFELLTACVQCTSSNDPERASFFQILSQPTNREDFHLQLVSLIELSRHGKDLSGFHYDLLPLLTLWLKDTWSAATSERNARKKSTRQNSLPKEQAPYVEESNLSLLFGFIADIIKFSSNIITEPASSQLLSQILEICTSSATEADLKACNQVFDAIITYGDIPDSKLQPVVKVLCSIHSSLWNVHQDAWRCISNLCRSHHGLTMVRILMEILGKPLLDKSDDKQYSQNIKEVRGAISALEKLFAKDAKDGYPLVPFTLLMASLRKVLELDRTAVDCDTLQLIYSLFTHEGGIMQNVLDEDWSPMFEIVSTCSRRITDPVTNRSLIYNTIDVSAPSRDETPQQKFITKMGELIGGLIVRVEQLLNSPPLNFVQKDDCLKFFVKAHIYLPDTCAKLVIDHFIEYQCCSPSDLRWKDNINLILGGFLADRSRPSDIRLHALKAVTDVYVIVSVTDQPEIFEAFAVTVLTYVRDEKDISILQELIDFAVVMAEQTQDDGLFQHAVDIMRSVVTSDRMQSPLGSPPGSRHGILSSKSASSSATLPIMHSPSNIVVKGFIRVFMRTMFTDVSKSLLVFEELLAIAKASDCPTDSRISALKMFLRLRTDAMNRIFLTPFTESDALAASLYRTAGSLAMKHAADEAAQQSRLARAEDSNSRLSRSTSGGQAQPPPKQSFRLGSGMNRTLQRDHQMWMSPDSDALPDTTYGNATLRLVSIIENVDQKFSSQDLDTAGPVSDQLYLQQSGAQSITVKANVAEEDRHDFATDAPDNVLQNPIESIDPKLSDAKENEAGINDGLNSYQPVVQTILNIDSYLDVLCQLLDGGCDWEVYSYILVHLPSQLTNQALFKSSIPQIKKLRSLLCDLIRDNSFQEPPVSSGLRKADVAICLFHVLTMVTSYNREFSKAEEDEIVRTFLQGVGAWERAAKCCIHALSICCHELPGSITKALVTILQKMSQIITQQHVAIHILEFLACLSRLPELYVNFREEEYRTVFAICFRYLQNVRDQPSKDSNQRNSHPRARVSSAPLSTEINSVDSNAQTSSSDDLPQYVYALAYHVIIFWFLSLKLTDRAGQVGWIAKNLVSTDSNGKENIDEQAQVTLDFMQRVAYADVDESSADPDFTPELYGEILKKRWIIGHSVVTIEQATHKGWAQITKRHPSGTSCYMVREKFSPPPPHQISLTTDALRDAKHSRANFVLPSHLLLQLTASIPQGTEFTRPIALPDDDMTRRAVWALDRNPTVDGHKVGVIYIGDKQTQEVEILSNITGSGEYYTFLAGLATVTELKGAKFNTQGLDREYGMDGEKAFCWRDRVSEIVFHVTTQMPTNLENDPQCAHKKKHIGNDFVNIIFNNSGLPFKYDTFPSDFNYVNIVIAPESRLSFTAARDPRQEQLRKDPYYKVQVMSKPGFPEISPAAEMKIISLRKLPEFIRLLAMNASVFSSVWANREGGEHVSPWRNRLREINRLRAKHAPKRSNSTHISPPGTSNGAVSDAKNRESMTSIRRASVANFSFLSSSVDASSQRSSVMSTTEPEKGTNGDELMVDSLDFSRWA